MLTGMHPESANLRQAAFLNFAASHILCQNYFWSSGDPVLVKISQVTAGRAITILGHFFLVYSTKTKV